MAGSIELNGRRIPTQAVSGKAPIDASRFIPVVSAGSAQARVISREDLLPNPTIGLASAATVHFGDVLVDVFSPIYGSHYPLGAPAFVINEVRARLILNSVWSLALDSGDTEDQVLDFTIMKGNPGNYLKLLIGHSINGGYGAIMTVGIGGSQFNLELKAQSYHYFDLLLPGGSTSDRRVRLALSSAANSQRGAVCPIFQIELYDSIRIFPEPVIVG
jgi:hypothetical protein